MKESVEAFKKDFERTTAEIKFYCLVNMIKVLDQRILDLQQKVVLLTDITDNQNEVIGKLREEKRPVGRPKKVANGTIAEPVDESN